MITKKEIKTVSKPPSRIVWHILSNHLSCVYFRIHIELSYEINVHTLHTVCIFSHLYFYEHFPCQQIFFKYRI